MYFFVEMGKGIDLDTLYSRQEARTASIRGPQSDRMLTGGHVKYRHIKKLALRRWVWNSPPELGQNMTSTAAGGMTWTAPRF
jgi:hypothetical protein